jgi:hypothetical protein
MMTCPECGSENVNRYKHYDECLDCLHREYKGDKVKRKPGKAFMMAVRK